MKKVAIIPARYESTRFPGKPLAKIFGRELIDWVYFNARCVKELDDVIVATDDYRIETHCNENNIHCVRTTKKHETGTDRVSEVAQRIDAEYYINIQGDEPLAGPSVIKEAIDRYPLVNLMSKCTPSDLDDRSVPKVVTTHDSRALYYSRLPIPYQKGEVIPVHMKQVGIYGFSRKRLFQFNQLPVSSLEKVEGIEFLRFIENGIPIKMKEVPYDTISVDYKEDIKKVETHLYKRYSAIIFDFDGVIVDSVQIKSDAMKKLFPMISVDLEEGGRTRNEKIAYYYQKANGKPIDENTHKELLDEYQNLTKQELLEATRSEDIITLIKNSDFSFYIVSGTPTNILKELLDELGLSSYFKGIFGAEHQDKWEILQRINDRARAIYVGDTKNDRLEAKKADMPFFKYTIGETQIWEIFH